MPPCWFLVSDNIRLVGTPSGIRPGRFPRARRSMIVFGPFVAGLVGGRKAGSVGNTLPAVFAPALVLAIILFGLATALTGLPLIGVIAGAGGLILAVARAARSSSELSSEVRSPGRCVRLRLADLGYPSVMRQALRRGGTGNHHRTLCRRPTPSGELHGTGAEPDTHYQRARDDENGDNGL